MLHNAHVRRRHHVRIYAPEATPCPRCGSHMAPALVVCWPCFRVTERLTIACHAADVARWDAERDAREAEIAFT